MVLEKAGGGHGWKVVWPAVIVGTLFGLVAIQMIRVNRPRSTVVAELPQPYTSPGTIGGGTLTIGSRNYYSNRLYLNRRSKLVGTFRTPNVRSHVLVLVLDETNFEKWKTGADHQSLARTGYVPGGKIAVALDPGTYFLIIDNQQGNEELSIQTDFALQ